MSGEAEEDRIESYLQSHRLIRPQRGGGSVAALSISLIPNGLLSEGERESDKKRDEENENLLEVVNQPVLPNSSWGCRLCSLTFSTLSDHMEHFKSESHVTNLKRSLNQTGGGGGVGESENENDLNEDNESSDEEDSQMILESSEDSATSLISEFPEGKVSKIFTAQSGPQYLFQPSNSKWKFSLSTTLFDFEPLSNSNLNPWKLLSSTLSSYQQSNTHYISIFILRSGRFAGSIFNTATGKAVIHKVFRRYTVRAKAGGSQSSHDSQGKKAQSMGAQLRRYNEQALEQDIQKLLSSWKDLINSSSLILVSMPKTMRSVIFNSETGDRDYPLKSINSRVKFVPFQVGKPVYEETIQVYEKCLTISFTLNHQNESVFSSERLLETDNDMTQTVTSESRLEKVLEEPVVAETVYELSEEMRELWSACREGKLDQVQQLLLNHSEDSSHHIGLNDPLSLDDLYTLLHVVSECGYPKLVSLLLESGASPEVKDIRSRRPYHLSKDKETREAYRKFRGQAEEMWDWDACGVPPGLSDDSLRIQKEKEKEKKKRAKQRKKEEKLSQIESEIKEAEEKIEREKRLKEEEVFRASQAVTEAGVCANCQKSLYRIASYDIFDRRCCSSNCVVLLRRKLAADAAEKRLAGLGR